MCRLISCWSVSLLLLLAPAARAEVNIPAECRIKNRPPGRCGWCALETLARHHQIAVLYGLTKSRATLSSPEDLEKALDEAGVPYRIQYPGNYNRAILRYAIQKNLGAAIGLYGNYNGCGPHIVTLIDYGKDGVKIIDCNDKDRGTKHLSREQFLQLWDGFAIVLEVAAQAPATAAGESSSGCGK